MKGNTNLTSFSYYFNMGFLKVFGRLLIITALVSSVYHHLNHPQQSVEEFRNNYKAVDTLSTTYLDYDIPFDNANWVMGVKIFGLFEALVACLIVFGDAMGGFLYLVSIVFQIFFLVWPAFLSNTINKWNFNQLEELSHYVTLLGIGLVLISCAGGKSEQKAASSKK